VLAAARAEAEQRFCAQTVARLSPEAIERIEELSGAGRPDVAGGRLLAELKADPGPLGLETLLTEIAKLGRVRAIGLPQDLFAGVSKKLVTARRARAATQYPSHLQGMAQPVRLTLLAALCWQRAAEITDGLVDLLIQLVHRINARAESRVEGEMVADLQRVAGKQGILFRLAGAALEQPDETVRRAIYPVVGEGTLCDLVREAMANEAAMKRRIRTVLRSSYSNHYRRMLPQLLAALEFRCNNTAYRPVMGGDRPPAPVRAAEAGARPPQHPASGAGAGRAGVAGHPDGRRPAGADAAVLVERQPVWALPSGHGAAPGLRGAIASVGEWIDLGRRRSRRVNVRGELLRAASLRRARERATRGSLTGRSSSAV
jgi:hypothetical protein